MIQPYQNGGMQYVIADNRPKHIKKRIEGRTGRGALLGMAGLLTVFLLAILMGLLINDKSDKVDIAAIGRALAAGVAPGELGKKEGEIPAPLEDGRFPTQSTATARGEAIACDDTGAVFLRTAHGVCRVRQSGSTYAYDGWAIELDAGVEIRAMSVYDGFLYMACGSDGMMRADISQSNAAEKIMDTYVVSFVIAENRILYLSQTDESDGCGELYMANLDGSGVKSLGEQVICAKLSDGSADLLYEGGYLYYLDSGSNLYRMYADGTGKKLLAGRKKISRSYTGCGLYYNHDVIYLPSPDEGIYAYDITANTVKKITQADVYCRAPILFAGDALLYRNRGIWRQIIGGDDTAYDSKLNDGTLQILGSADGSLFCFTSSHQYYQVLYENGRVRSEKAVDMDYGRTSYVDAVPSAWDRVPQDTQIMIPASRVGCYTEGYMVLYYDWSEELDWLEEEEEIARWLVYWDGEDVHALFEGRIGGFAVMDGEVYYTTMDMETEEDQLWRQKLDRNAQPELLLEAGVSDFSLYDGRIYYTNGVDENALYCYDPSSGDNRKLCDDPIGCYCIFQDTVYYAGLYSGTVCKMKLDGTGERTLFFLEEYDVAYVSAMTAVLYANQTYLALMGHYELHFVAEDGSFHERIGRVFENYDMRQDLYCADGYLYYSSDNGMQVNKLDIAQYFGGGRMRSGSASEVICEENFSRFEVSGGRIFVQMYLDSEIKVFDAQTGEQLKDYDIYQFGEFDLFDF